MRTPASAPPRPLAAAAAAAAVLLQAVCAAASEGIKSGDTIFLWSYNNRTVDIEADAAKARYSLRGGWQALQIQKVALDDGTIRGGDGVILYHAGLCLSVDNKQEVRARSDTTCQTWIITKRDGGNEQIQTGDHVFFQVLNEPRYLDHEGDSSALVRARWGETGTWQTFTIEREPPLSVKAGDAITLSLPSGAKVDVQGTLVRARWSEAGWFRALFREGDENVGPWMHALTIYGGHGRALYSGDQVNLWGFTGKALDAGVPAIQARFGEAHKWQTFTIFKDEGGAILVGDAVALRAHTGQWIEVNQRKQLQATAKDSSTAAHFTIGAFSGETSPNDKYRQLCVFFVLCMTACAVLAYELYWSNAAKGAATQLAAALHRSSGDAAAAAGQPQPQQPAAPTTSGAPRLEALDAPRWLASAQIVAGHFYEFEWGAVWTQFFFILSGFVLAYSELSKPAGKGSQMSQLRYVAHRLTTLYPTYLFVLVISAIQWNHGALDWLSLPMHVFLMHAWFPITYRRYGEGPWSWIGFQWVAVSWFISVLIPYWLLLRPLAKRARGMSKWACVLALALLWAVAVGHWALYKNVVKEGYGCRVDTDRCWWIFGNAMVYHGVIGNVHTFVAGIVLARLFILTSMCDASTGAPPTPETEKLALDTKRAPLLFKYGAILGYTMFVLMVKFVKVEVLQQYMYIFHQGGVLPILLLILGAGALGVDPIVKYLFNNRFFKLLGRISYAQYLLQVNVYYVLKPIFPDDSSAVPYTVVYPVALFVSAYLTERLVTRVGVEWLKSGKGGKRDGSVERVLTLLEKRLPFGRRSSSSLGQDATKPAAAGVGATAGEGKEPEKAQAAPASVEIEVDEERPTPVAGDTVPPLAFAFKTDSPPVSEAPFSGSSTWRARQAHAQARLELSGGREELRRSIGAS